MTRVFVVAETAQERYNLDGLRQFGNIVFLYARDERKPSIYNVSQFASSIATRLNDHSFDARHDYVALVGRQVEVGILFYVLGLLAGDVKIAFFDAAKTEYSENELKANVIPDLKSA